MLTHTTEIIKDMEEEVREEFPAVTQIDLELDLTNIHKDYRGLISLETDDEGGPSKR